MTLLATVLRDHAYKELCKYPQWAYVHHQGTGDAINRVATHCMEARELEYSQHRRTPHIIAQGHAPMAVGGGLQLLIDLKRAFDSMPRKFLVESLQAIWPRSLVHG